MLGGTENLPDFHPLTVVRDWGNGQAFRIADALTGVCVFGATGSGKTSGPAKHLAYGYLGLGFGGLVLCAKKEERRQWEQWAKDAERTDDLVIVDSTGKWRFNFLEWEASRPDASGGLTINIVAILDEIAGAVAKASGKSESGRRVETTNFGRMLCITSIPIWSSFPCLPALKFPCRCCVRF